MTNSKADLPSGDNLGSLLHRIAVRLWRQGPFWLFHRALQEIRYPLTGPGRLINAGIRRIEHPLFHLFSQSPAGPKDALIAIYDLAVEPNTFDVLWFLIAAEQHRRRRQLGSLHVVFAGVDGTEQNGSSDYEVVVSRSSQRDRILNVLAAAAGMVPSMNGVEVLHDRRELRARVAASPAKRVFPENYSTTFHRSCLLDCIREMHQLRREDVVDTFRSSEAGLSYIDRWAAAHAGGSRVVSITLRHYDYMPARNSDLVAWAQFARYLIERSYCPVFIPDTESMADGIPESLREFQNLPEAAWNLNLRLALYERAFLNLGVNNGPAHLFILSNRTRGLMFKMTTPGVPQAEPSFIAKQGFTLGGQLPFRTPFQKWVWENDTFDVIKREFEEMEKRILDDESERSRRPA